MQTWKNTQLAHQYVKTHAHMETINQKIEIKLTFIPTMILIIKKAGDSKNWLNYLIIINFRHYSFFKNKHEFSR